MAHIDLDLSAVPPSIQRTSTKEMLSITAKDGRTLVRINSSSLSVIQTCARKSYYVLKRQLRAQSEAPATLFGSAIHAALETFYSGKREERRIPKDFRKISDMLPSHTGSIAMPHWELQDELLYRAITKFCEKAAPLRALPDSDKRSLSAGVWLLQNYFETYIDDPFTVLCDAQGPITERTVEDVIYEDDKIQITLFGTIDVVLQNQQTGVILPTDHKTSSVVGTDFYNRLKPNHQYTGYLWLAQRKLSLETDSFLVNCLQVKPKPVTARGTPPHFPRQVTRRSDEDMKEFVETIYSAVTDFLRWDERGIWPIGCVDNCTHYGGCQFLDVCGAPNSLRENIISSKFQPPEGESCARAQ